MVQTVQILVQNRCRSKKEGVTPGDYAYSYQLVPKRGFEPRQGNPYWTLNPARLPVPPLRQDAKVLPLFPWQFPKFIYIV
jgi:hypothetical protein